MIVGYFGGKDNNPGTNGTGDGNNSSASSSTNDHRSEQRLSLLRAKEKAARANAEAERAIAAAKRADAYALQGEVAAKRAEADALVAEAAAKRADADALQAEAAAKRAEADHVAVRLAIIEAEQHEESNGQTPSRNGAWVSPNHNTKKQCPACHTSGHNLVDCKIFKDTELNEKWDIINREKLCFRCFRTRTKNHRCKTEKCNINGCNNVHNPLLHKYKPGEERLPDFEPLTYLMEVPVTIKGPSGLVQTWAIFGSASEVSLIDSVLAEQVGAKGPCDPLHAKGLFGPIDAPESRRVTLTLISQSNVHYQLQFNTMDDLKLMPQNVREEDIAHCSHLQDLRHLLVTNGTVTPKIMIGADYGELFDFKEVRKGSKGQPAAVRTPLGWLIMGTNARVPAQNNYFTSSVLTRLTEL